MFPSHRHVLPLVAVVTLLLLPCAAAPPAPVAVPLKRALPSEIARLLLSPSGFVTNADGPAAVASDGTPLPSAALLPPGIVSLAPDDDARVLRVQGTPEGIAALRNLVRLLDVPRAFVRLSVRLLRVQRGGARQVLASAEATTGNSVPVPVTLRIAEPSAVVGDVIAVISPRINGDGSVTLAVGLRVVDPVSGATRRSLEAQQRLRPGRRATFSALDVPGDGPNARPARVLLEITPRKTGPSPGRA